MLRKTYIRTDFRALTLDTIRYKVDSMIEYKLQRVPKKCHSDWSDDKTSFDEDMVEIVNEIKNWSF